MPINRTSEVIEHLRGVVLRHEGAGLTDGQLLECFVSRREEAALAALVERHGPMVWGVCRRVLRHHHDAEDAFQATFLVLVRKAASIAPREKVANWLYGVAHQTARKARATAARRKLREKQVPEFPEVECRSRDLWLDLQPLLDQELGRLPDKYRQLIVLCDLEGRTRKQVALQLGVPEGTVAGRLARARVMLAKRLARQGVVLSGGLLAGLLSHNAASAQVPAPLLASAIHAATLHATGRTASGVISPMVLALTEGALQAMLLTKLRTALVMVLAVVALGWGGAFVWHAHADDRASPNGSSGEEKPGKKPEQDHLRNTLLALDKHFWEASAKGDAEELAKFLADDFVSVSILGKYDKTSNLAACKRYRLADWAIHDPEVIHVSKDTAVVTYRYDCKVLSADRELLETRKDYRVVFVWANRDGGWVMVFGYDDHGRRSEGGPPGIEPGRGRGWKELYQDTIRSKREQREP
jgi:RNA polymerase sigma factor (sigma-70 family)